MQEPHIDLSARGFAVRDHVVTSASTELINSRAGDIDELLEDLREFFESDGSWCAVGSDLHSISFGDAELRLRPDLGDWHADLFHAAWGSPLYESVPPEARQVVAAYVDRAREVRPGLLQEGALYQAAAQGGARAVDRLVRGHIAELDAWFQALDDLHAGTLAGSDELPHWARALILSETEDLNMAREWAGSAVLNYHHGSAGRRPDTLLGGIWFQFSTGAVNLARKAFDEFNDAAVRS